MTKLNYHDLPEHVQLYLHATELHAIIKQVRTLLNREDALQFIKKQLNQASNLNNADAWNDEINAFYSVRQKQPLDKDDLALYYIVAGCGINRIQNLVKIGQPAIYRQRDRTDWSRKHTTLEGMFRTDEGTLHGIQRMASAFNILDGFRVTEEGQLPSYDAQHENFKKKNSSEPRMMTPEEMAAFERNNSY